MSCYSQSINKLMSSSSLEGKVLLKPSSTFKGGLTFLETTQVTRSICLCAHLHVHCAYSATNMAFCTVAHTYLKDQETLVYLRVQC